MKNEKITIFARPMRLKMKKILTMLAVIGAVATALTATSCQKQEVLVTDEYTWVVDFIFSSTSDLSSEAVTNTFNSIESKLEALSEEVEASFTQVVNNEAFSDGDAQAMTLYEAALEKVKSLETNLLSAIAAIPSGSEGGFKFNCLLYTDRHNSSFTASKELADYNFFLEY